jgi:hypothetical protein
MLFFIPIMLKLEPRRAKARIETPLPSTMKSTTDNALPIRAKLRQLKELPKLAKSMHDKPPMRAVERRLKLDPKITKSKTLMLRDMNNLLTSEMLEPSRLNPRKEMLEPIDVKSNIETPLPTRPKDRTETELPAYKKSQILNLDPNSTLSWMLKRVACAIITPPPCRRFPLTLKEDPNRVNPRNDKELPAVM